MSPSRTALVTASTSGLGLAAAAALSAMGVTVVISGRRAEVAEAEAASMPNAIGMELDLMSTESLQRAVVRLRTEVTNIDILVLNSAGPQPSTALDCSPDTLRVAIDTVVSPAIALCQAFVPGMQARRWGRVIALGSSGIRQPIPGLAPSNAARAALSGYLKTLAGEVASDGVTVNVVSPGRIDTDRVKRIDEANARRLGTSVDEVRQRSRMEIPIGRYGSVAEFASAVAFVASEGASYMTGTELRIDGGLVRSVG